MTNFAKTAIPLPTVRTHTFDPPRELATLRERSPLTRLSYPDGHVGWLVTSYALAEAVLIDDRFVIRMAQWPVGDPERAEAVHQTSSAEFQRVHAGNLLWVDPPAHTRLRQLQTPHFTARKADELRPRIERIVDAQLDQMKNAGSPADLVAEFAFPFPALVLCDVLGLPHRDRDRIERLNASLQDPDVTAEEKAAANTEYLNYARTVIRQKRDQPGDDVLSELATTELSDDELAGLALLLFGGGHETTASTLALGTLVLLSHRDQWEALQSNPELIETAVDELLRYVTVVQLGAFTRVAIEDVELGGAVIRRGERVTASLAAANRDAERFPDADKLDLTRAARRHLAFGRGRHMCIGQHLARLELQVGFARLIERFPTLHLACAPDEVRLHHHENPLHGVYELPVAW